MSQEDMDHSFDLPYTRLPHPKYKGKRIPAYEMIKFSVNSTADVSGGCAFCTNFHASGQIHRQPQQGEYTEGGKANRGNAGL